ncbi:MAG: hypothetical protein KBD64_06595 [Gammaproteobacteria bacterium]|nr:hypothetical protein [Gammaproteobacteria bacterium]
MTNNSNNSNNCSNLIFLADHIERRKGQEIESLLTNDRNILKIMTEDIEQRIQFLGLQYEQLDLLSTIKKLTQEFIATKPSPEQSIEPLLGKLLKYDLSILSFSMHHALVDCLEGLHRKEVELALPQIECISEDLFNLQEKKLLITELQLSKVEEIVKLHYLHYQDIINQASENPHISRAQVQEERDNLSNRKELIANAFAKQKALKKEALKNHADNERK